MAASPRSDRSSSGLASVSGLTGHFAWTGPGAIHSVHVHEGQVASSHRRTGAPLATEATALVGFGNSFLVLSEAGHAFEVTADLERVRRIDLAGAHRSLSGQPLIDPVTGELHLLGSPADVPQLRVSVSAGGLTRTVRSIEDAPGPISQLASTGDHLLYVAAGHVGVQARTGRDAITTWFAVDTDGRQVATAYERGDATVALVTGPSLERWTLHRRRATVDCEVLDATRHSFVAGNHREGAPPRFLWTIGSGAAHKHDLHFGTSERRAVGGGAHAAALHFVTDPERAHLEDGGWLVGIVRRATRDESRFVVLDTEDFGRPPVVMTLIPQRIGSGARIAWLSARR